MDTPYQDPEEAEADEQHPEEKRIHEPLTHVIYKRDGVAMLATPEGEYREQFERRPPALGLGTLELDMWENIYRTQCRTERARNSAFRALRGQMLRYLKPVSGMQTVLTQTLPPTLNITQSSRGPTPEPFLAQLNP